MKGHNIIKNADGSRELDIANCIDGVNVVKNNIEARCQVIRGELLYNVLLGIPLHAEKEDIDLTVMNIILNTSGVSEIQNFNSYIKNKKYSANVAVLIENTVVEVNI